MEVTKVKDNMYKEYTDKELEELQCEQDWVDGIEECRNQNEGVRVQEMKTKKTIPKINKRRITLKDVWQFGNHPNCIFCGRLGDHSGLDYCVEGVVHGGDGYVCEFCAEKHAPEMVVARKTAVKHAKRGKLLMIETLRAKILNAINEPIEKRVTRIIHESFTYFNDERIW